MAAKRSMSQIYLLGLVSMATLPAILMGYLWVGDQWQQFDAQSRFWRDTYIEAQQQTLRRRVSELINNLEYERSRIDERQRTALRLAVDNGVAQLDALRRQPSVSGSERTALLRRARDLLAPIRFGAGRDHYFIHSAEGRVLLSPADPKSEGKRVDQLLDANGVKFGSKLAETAQGLGEAYQEVWHSRPDGGANAYLTLHYARYYPALNLYVGAVGYVEDMVAAAQQAELARLSITQDDVVITIGDERGNVVYDQYEPGTYGNLAARAEVLSPGLSEKMRGLAAQPDGALTSLQRPHRDTGEPLSMLMYVRQYPHWRWWVGAGFFLNDIDASIAERREAMRQHITQRIALGSFGLFLLVALALAISRRLALRTRDALRSFTTFFSQASRHSTAIDVAQLPYVEFEQLALDANRMIEQRNRIEETLRESEQRFEKALRVANVHLWDVDLHDALLTVSGTLFAQLGYDGEMRVIDLAEADQWMHPDDLSAARRAQASMLDGSDTLSLEFRLRAADGSYRWFASLGGIVTRDSSGRPLRALGTLAEISIRKQMEQELIAARIAAEDANHAKSLFLSSISHELRTPLNGVLGYAQILLRDHDASAEQRHNLRAIESCGQHLLTLIDDVLDLAKIESGTIEIQRTPCDLYDLLESVSNIVRERVEHKGLLYSLIIDEEVPATALVDEVKLRQILVNLLGNAAKFTPRGGITLKVELRGDDELLFQVSDTGVGIPQSKQREIFQPFQQLHSAQGGTGLGLPISQRLCEAMGGTLTLQSAPGMGSCFTFNLPFERATGAGISNPQRSAYQVIDTGGKAITVMVVDDNPINRQVLAGMLRASGVDVVEAEHGQDALDQLRARPLPLVLMDVRMPVMDGYAATAAIKSDASLRGTVVIAVSASVFPEVIARMRAEGCDDFVTKPVRVGELLAKVAQYLKLPLRTVELATVDERAPSEAQLPGPLIAPLRAAVALGDMAAMRAALDGLRGPALQSPLVAHIESLLDNFDIDAVRDLLADEGSSAER